MDLKKQIKNILLEMDFSFTDEIYDPIDYSDDIFWSGRKFKHMATKEIIQVIGTDIDEYGDKLVIVTFNNDEPKEKLYRYAVGWVEDGYWNSIDNGLEEQMDFSFVDEINIYDPYDPHNLLNRQMWYVDREFGLRRSAGWKITDILDDNVFELTMDDGSTTEWEIDDAIDIIKTGRWVFDDELDKKDLSEGDFDFTDEIDYQYHEQFRYFDIYVCLDSEYNPMTGEDECIDGYSAFVKIPEFEFVSNIVWDHGIDYMAGPGDEGSEILSWSIENQWIPPYDMDYAEYVREVEHREYCMARMDEEVCNE